MPQLFSARTTKRLLGHLISVTNPMINLIFVKKKFVLKIKVIGIQVDLEK